MSRQITSLLKALLNVEASASVPKLSNAQMLDAPENSAIRITKCWSTTGAGSPMKFGSNRRPAIPPGHFAVRISSKGQDGVITGDLMHHPIQCRYPEWDDNFDTDGPLAKKTRRAFCERYADSGMLVFGTHFALPSPGRISKRDGSFRFSLAR